MCQQQVKSNRKNEEDAGSKSTSCIVEGMLFLCTKGKVKARVHRKFLCTLGENDKCALVKDENKNVMLPLSSRTNRNKKKEKTRRMEKFQHSTSDLPSQDRMGFRGRGCMHWFAINEGLLQQSCYTVSAGLQAPASWRCRLPEALQSHQ